MDERARRIGENEALYRSVNERIEDLNQAFGMVTSTMTAVCECGDATCAEQIEIPLAEYERIRSNPARFFIVPGHQAEGVEDVVEEYDGFAVVEKRSGGPAELARELDPRS